MLKKENGRLKEEIFINKTVSMKVEQNNYPLSSRVSQTVQVEVDDYLPG
jgi:hypothetical protein